jgi:hypothetical protein
VKKEKEKAKKIEEIEEYKVRLVVPDPSRKK